MDLGMNDRQLVLRESTGDLDDDTPARSGPVLSMGMCCLVNRWLGVRVPSSALGLTWHSRVTRFVTRNCGNWWGFRQSAGAAALLVEPGEGRREAMLRTFNPWVHRSR